MTPPNADSKSQRKKRFYRAARNYAKVYLAKVNGNPATSHKQLRVALERLELAARQLPASEPQPTAPSPEQQVIRSPIVHLLGAGHGYRNNPNPQNSQRLTTLAVNWYREDQTEERTTKGEAFHHVFTKHRGRSGSAATLRRFAVPGAEPV